MCSNSPEFWVDVVDWTMMKSSAAREIGIARLRSAKIARVSFRMSRRPNAPRMRVLPCQSTRPPAMKARATRVGQEQVDDQARHNGRKPHERIQERSHCATSREAVHRQHSTHGKAEEGGDSHRGQRDLEGQRYDLEELRIERDDLP